MDSLQKNDQKSQRVPKPLNRPESSRGLDTPVCATRHLGKSFPGVRALHDISLSFQAGKVHALMGENGAGKSTLLKCLFGLYTPDEGEILVDGRPLRFQNPRDAMACGFAMVHQELHPIRDMSVVENLWLGRMRKTRLGFVDFKSMEQESRRLFEDWHIDLDPQATVGDLSVSKIQSLEIAKAIFGGARLLIMDEPTSSLSEKEVLSLYKTIARLKNHGTAIVYISHKMDEIKQLADDITIMRDGKVVGTYKAPEISRDQVITLMVGRELTQLFPEKSSFATTPEATDILLEVEDVGHHFDGTKKRGQSPLHKIRFSVRRGEILGVGGLVGSGRSELLKGLFGLMPFTTGTVRLGRRSVALKTPQDALKARLGYISEDRRLEGIFPQLSIVDNLMMSSQTQFLKHAFWIDGQRRLQATQEAIQQFRIKTPSPWTPIVNLSGGNQQKVLLARAMTTRPEVLLLDEPTRGIDVGAKHEIYLLMREFVEKGGSIIFVSSELPELIGLAHRVLILCDGRQAALLEGDDLTEGHLMRAATAFH